MKKCFVVALAVVAMTASGFSAEWDEYTYLGGVYTFSVPSGWQVQADEETYTGVTVAPKKATGAHLIFMSPNPHVEEEDLDGYVGAYLGKKFESMGTGELLEADWKGSIFNATYAMELGGDDAAGTTVAMMAGDYAVLVDVVAPLSDKEFMNAFERVLESLDVGTDQIEGYAEELAAIGESMLEQMAE